MGYGGVNNFAFGHKKTPNDSGSVVLTGIEPVTHGFSVRCSTN